MLRGYPKSGVLCVFLESTLAEMTWYEPLGLVDTVSSSSDPNYTSNEGFQTLQQQCVPIMTAQNPTFCTGSISKI